MATFRTSVVSVVTGACVLVLTAWIGSAQQPATPQQPAPVPVPLILKNYKAVTAERLLKPEDSDWLMVRRTYDGWGYAPLDQITVGNLDRWRPVWVFATGQTNGHEAPPIVNNGAMFVATPAIQVIA